MKMICILMSFFITIHSFAQLPLDYKLVKGASPAGRGDYFTNGRIKFVKDTPLMGDDFGDKQNIESLSSTYGIVFKKTKDNMYVGDGFSNGKFRFVVYKKYAYIVISETNSKEYIDMCQFVFNAVRNNDFWN